MASEAELLPSADEVTTYIRQGYCDWVINIPAGTRVDPEELWLPTLACWVRADGSSICGDRGRGYSYPGLIGRARIKNAVKWFRAATDKEAETLARLLPTHQEPPHAGE